MDGVPWIIIRLETRAAVFESLVTESALVRRIGAMRVKRRAFDAQCGAATNLGVIFRPVSVHSARALSASGS